ncbi:MAG: hypothetical protein SOY98_08040, partial [Candidatus Cryptobacteroides sp.]|nr:hypothetical protein [Candidatus Cryptobacteroides sp.]
SSLAGAGYYIEAADSGSFVICKGPSGKEQRKKSVPGLNLVLPYPSASQARLQARVITLKPPIPAAS